MDRSLAIFHTTKQLDFASPGDYYYRHHHHHHHHCVIVEDSSWTTLHSVTSPRKGESIDFFDPRTEERGQVRTASIGILEALSADLRSDQNSQLFEELNMSQSIILSMSSRII